MAAAGPSHPRVRRRARQRAGGPSPVRAAWSPTGRTIVAEAAPAGALAGAGDGGRLFLLRAFPPPVFDGGGGRGCRSGAQADGSGVRAAGSGLPRPEGEAVGGTVAASGSLFACPLPSLLCFTHAGRLQPSGRRIWHGRRWRQRGQRRLAAVAAGGDRWRQLGIVMALGIALPSGCPPPPHGPSGGARQWSAEPVAAAVAVGGYRWRLWQRLGLVMALGTILPSRCSPLTTLATAAAAGPSRS